MEEAPIPVPVPLKPQAHGDPVSEVTFLASCPPHVHLRPSVGTQRSCRDDVAVEKIRTRLAFLILLEPHPDPRPQPGLPGHLCPRTAGLPSRHVPNQDRPMLLGW